ncbi:type II toxin-antitoxin system RelB family antitoxin [Levilactobacillus yonginensis]|uniref:type II toxin-antitoxin system RelB family antitoxin n=1 Tax=Levilactobacillus yonginensis TaxID=1054041 RepID=UPI00345DBFDF
MTQATSVRFDSETNALLNVYTQAHGISKSEYIKRVVAESLEDWADIQAADQAFQAWKADNFKTKSWQDTLKELKLDDE